MKKGVLTILAMLVIVIMSSAQEQKSTLNENFDVTELPAGWSQINSDGDNYWFKIYNIGSTEAHSGTNVAGSFSFYNGTVLTPDNWLITPQLSVDATTDSIAYWVRTLDPNYPTEHYAVMVSTTGANVSDFTTTLYETTLASTNDVWARKAFSLSGFVGQNIYIAFRHFNSTDNYGMVIDDVTGPDINTTDINDFDAESEIHVSLFPSPATSVLNIESDQNFKGVRIMNLIGEEVYSSNVNAKSVTINTGSFKSGLYLLQMECDNTVNTYRFIVE